MDYLAGNVQLVIAIFEINLKYLVHNLLHQNIIYHEWHRVFCIRKGLEL